MKAGRMAAFGAGAAGVFALHSLIPAVYNKRWNPYVMKKTGILGTVMLTFDDGPDSRYTGLILDYLKEQDVKAVFFTVAREAVKNRDIIERMIGEGHVVGFHSVDHQNAMLRSWFYTRRDLKEGHRFMTEYGIGQIFYRPPWGLTNLFSWYYVKKYGMKMVLWDVMAEDWEKRATADSIYRKCMERVKDQSVICLHDGGENSGGAAGAPLKTLEALKRIIPELKEEGYRFVLPV
ncbi:polysaccharide deacetylase family protein [Clostridium sp. MCC353]|uniref:polysaccharide deacetylase family protein n=1 Tax=Clostridium sp. MCC353 TaxID=2592646 RepID=UPI00207979A0|nr:polysaccharide deacetylase family protein [Clostridium sp. MCC353]